jgi:hypothetical protein
MCLLVKQRTLSKPPSNTAVMRTGSPSILTKAKRSIPALCRSPCRHLFSFDAYRLFNAPVGFVLVALLPKCGRQQEKQAQEYN